MSELRSRTFAVVFSRALPYLYLAAVAWINFYIVRDLFTIETTARMNSMHGFWTALARLGQDSWWTPTWWPFWDGGMPFEYAYAPLIPGAAALLAKIFGTSELHALQCVFALILGLGPALLYWAVWRLTGAPGWSFAAAVAYSLLSPALLLAPNQDFSFQTLFYFERFYVTLEWDEGPHMAALALWGPAVLCLFRMVETHRPIWLAAGVPLMAAMVYASAFGATLLAITAICVLGAMGFSWKGVGITAAAGALTYLSAMAALPPSLVKIIRAAADFHGEGWTSSSGTALGLTALCWTIVQPRLMRLTSDSRLRFFVLFAMTCLLIVWLREFGGRQFLPQSTRYKQELSIGLALAGVFAFRSLWHRLSRPVRAATLVLALALAAEQTIAARRWAKPLIQDRDITATIEYRAAKAVEAHVAPEARILAPGSIFQWLNAFSLQPQILGGSWSTAPNLMQQVAKQEVFWERGGVETSLRWLRAFGVDAVLAVGPDSPEYWKPYQDPGKYEGRFEKLWSEQDTTLYKTPRRIRSLAHALPESARTTASRESVDDYVAALESERLPGLAFRWNGRNRASVDGEVHWGEAISIQVNHHPGWRAWVGKRQVAIERDGLGLMWIDADCDGPCAIELEYTGGFELRIARWISGLTLLSMALVGVREWRRKLTGRKP